MQKLASLLAVAGLLLSFGHTFAQGTNEQSSIGVGFNLGLQYPFCDVDPAGVGPAGEFITRFILSERFNLSIALGYGIINDGFSYNTFETSLITGDIKANLNLLKPGKFNPYVFLGAGVFNYGYMQNKDWAKVTPDLGGERYYDGSFIYGGGFELMLTPKMYLNAFADYRHTSSDGLDGYEGQFSKSNDGYLNGRVGLTFYLGKGRTPRQVPEDELLALQRLEYGEAGTGNASMSSGDRLSMFEAKLDKLETSDSEFTMEQYVRLKSRVDELNQLIDGKEQELGDLRATLDFKNQRITDLEMALSQSQTSGPSYTSSGTFTQDYESALRNFYSRDYNRSIQIMTDLKSRYANHRLASNCQYWIGECYFGLGNYRQAADAFESVYNYGFSYKHDDATLMLGRCFQMMGDVDSARSYYRKIIDEYPDSEYVEKARRWLGIIG